MSEEYQDQKIYLLLNDPSLIDQKYIDFFLEKKITLQVFDNLDNILKQFSKDPPLILCISMNFNHPKVVMIPGIFMKYGHCKILAFMEKNNNEGSNRIASTNCDYRISGKLSVNALWVKAKMAMHQSEMEDRWAATESRQRGNAAVNTKISSSEVHIKEKNIQVKGAKNDSLSSGMSVEDKLKNRFQYDDDDEDLVHALSEKDRQIEIEEPIDAPNTTEGTSLNVIHSERKVEGINSVDGNIEKKKSFSHIKGSKVNKKEELNMELFEKELESVYLDKGEQLSPLQTAAQESRQDDLSELDSQEENKTEKNEIYYEPEPSEHKNNLVMPESLKKNNKPKQPMFEAELEKADSEREVSEDQKGKNKPKSSEPIQDEVIPKPSFGSINLNNNNLENKKEKELLNLKKKGERTKLIKEVQQKISDFEIVCENSLKETFDVKEATELKFNEVSVVAVIPVNDEKLKGFVILAINSNERFDPDHLMEFRSKISNMAGTYGIKNVEECYSFNIPPTKILDWSEEHAEFSIIKENSESLEIVVSFIMREKVSPTLKPYIDHEMYLIDIQHLPPDTDVDFDAYIHLPKNEKYVHYIKKGKSISLDQVKNLMKNNVQGLCLPADEKNNFKKFFVRKTIEWEFLSYQKTKSVA